MVIDNLNIDRAGRVLRPLKANPPLIIDTDAVLALPVALEGFQPIAGKGGEVFQARRRVQAVEPRFGLTCETGKFFEVIAIGEPPGFVVPVTHDHDE